MFGRGWAGSSVDSLILRPIACQTTVMTLPTPQEMVDLSGRVVVVTGGAGGIGSGIVRRLADARATTVVHYRNSRDRAEQIVAGVVVEGGEAVAVEADLATDDGPRRLFDGVIDRFGRLDGLVNNAGIQPLAELATVSDEQWRRMLEVNLTAVHRCTQAAALIMREGGSIVYVASIEATHPAPSHGHYATAKAAVVMHARAAAQELGRGRIRVNVVSPGLIDRPGLAEHWPEGVERWLKAAPLARLGAPEDIGDACVFLLSDLARWVTGAELIVDGGVTARPTW